MSAKGPVVPKKRATKKIPAIKTNKASDRQIDSNNKPAKRSSVIPIEFAPVEALPPPSSNDSREAQAPRKRTIMGRYVYGDEPKPGERWKHKLRKKW